MTTNIYTNSNSTYLKSNPDWHVSDSAWKAKQILKMLSRHALNPTRVAEIGCGAGEILNQLHENLSENVDFYGYEIAPDAFNLCKLRAKDRLTFFNANPFASGEKFDVLIAADVFEHVEDNYSFVKQCGKIADYKIYHIPLEMSVISVLRNMPIGAHHSVGHLHFYTKDTALAFLNDCGQTVVDYFYTPAAFEAPNRKIKTKVLNLPRWLLGKINKDLCVRVFGGFSLLVLTK